MRYASPDLISWKPLFVLGSVPERSYKYRSQYLIITGPSTSLSVFIKCSSFPLMAFPNSGDAVFSSVLLTKYTLLSL
jgi:hypothetical protein